MTSTVNSTNAQKLTIELDSAHHRRIKQIADECATSTSDIINEAIQFYLNASGEEVNAKLKQQPKI